MTEHEAVLLLSLIPGTAPATIREIYQSLGSFARFFNSENMSPIGSLAELAAYYRRHRPELEAQLDRRLAYMQSAGIAAVTLADTAYPDLLREIHRPPAVVYVKGCVDALTLPQVAIVGSRRASRNGLQQAGEFARALASGGFVVTSGLALGVDAAAHRGALVAGKTVAVLGTGVDVAYPRRNAGLYEEILSGGGAIVSEFAPGAPPLRQHFPRRNRIISGLSLGTLIVEAAAKSGSLITARLAMEQGREVFAVPGSVHNPLARGCHRLIREGAVLTETVDDIVEQLGGMLSLVAEQASSTPAPIPGLSRDEDRILAAMGFDPVAVDSLQQHLAMDIAALTSALVGLEIRGLVEQIDGRYQRLKS